MSEFKVEVVKIDDVIDHPNADRLSINKIADFECISNKKEDGSHRYNPGDLVVYIPEASVLPEWLLKEMGFWNEEKQKGTLSGSRGNRVKPVKLRDIFSQGLLYPVLTCQNAGEMYIYCQGEVHYPVHKCDDVTEFLNIHKYEPPIPVYLSGKVGNLHGYTVSYDIENFQKYGDKVFKEDDYVVATEKLHGTYFQIGILSDLSSEDKEKALSNKDIIEVGKYEKAYAYVTSKGLAGKGLVQKSSDDNLNNLYQKVLQELKNNGTLDTIVDDLYSYTKNFKFYIMGEIYGKGVQDLHYGLNQTDFRVFDILCYDGDLGIKSYMNILARENFCSNYNIKHVPILYSGPYDKEELKKHRDGPTTLGNQHIREGIVIEHVDGDDENMGNRRKLKWVSPDYLLRKGGTEFN